MSITIIGGAGNGNTPYPAVFAPPIIEIAKDWATLMSVQSIVVNPELVLVSCAVHAGSTMSTCEIERRYGNVKFPHDPDFNKTPAKDITGWWLRMSILDDQGNPSVQFIGQIEASSRVMTGTHTDGSGVQNWVASGGLKTLQRITISEAGFIDDGTGVVTKVGWIPAMNAHDKRGLLVGNKSLSGDAKSSYYYGGIQTWTHLDYLRYIVGVFVQQTTGPKWTIGGQTDILQSLQTTIQFPQAINAAEMLKHLIPVKYGVDFKIIPTVTGFEISVFALLDSAFAIAGVTMPANPDIVKVIRTGDISLFETHVVESSERRVDKVQVCGKRIVVCGTLKGDQAGGVSLVKKWSDSVEADYKDAGGFNSSSTSEQADKARKRDKYRDVYQHLGAPVPWDMDGNNWNVSCKDDGTLTTSGQIQNSVRKTLPWLPLKEGFDYSQTPPKDNTLALTNDIPDFRPPLIIVYDPQSQDDNGNPTPQYFLAEHRGIGCHVAHNDWGVWLHASPNHLMGLNHFQSNEGAGPDYSEKDPKFDYEHTIATVAIESNHRLKLTYNMPPNLAAGDGSVMTIIDEGAEAWVLLPSTVVDLNDSGFPVYGGTQQVELRNDKSRLALIMAGAVTKYINERFRCQLVSKGFGAWGDLLGKILTVIQQGDIVQTVGAPITSVEWILGQSPQMIAKAGYA